MPRGARWWLAAGKPGAGSRRWGRHPLVWWPMSPVLCCARAAALCMLEAIGLHYYYYLPTPRRVERSERRENTHLDCVR